VSYFFSVEIENKNQVLDLPDVAIPHQNTPTTANILYYDSGEGLENLSKIRFLDLEGENGGQPPRVFFSTIIIYSIL
jgi:hypothetical protein